MDSVFVAVSEALAHGEEVRTAGFDAMAGAWGFDALQSGDAQAEPKV